MIWVLWFVYLIKTDSAMYQDKPKDTIIKKLKIDESYEDFPEFYLKNKEEITRWEKVLSAGKNKCASW